MRRNLSRRDLFDWLVLLFRRRRRQVGQDRQLDCIGQAASAQTTKHPGPVQLHGPDADAELVGDRLVRLPENKPLENLALARRKPGDLLRGIKGDFLDMADIRLAKGRLNRIQQLVVRERLFEEVGRAWSMSTTMSAALSAWR